MKQPPPLPEPVLVPGNVLDRWQRVPSQEIVSNSLSKEDWQSLFFCLDHSISATAALQTALIAYSNGDMEAANEASWESSRRSAEAQNKLRQLMTSLMTSAI